MRKSRIIKEITDSAERLSHDIFDYYSGRAAIYDEFEAYISLVALSNRAEILYIIAGNLEVALSLRGENRTWKQFLEMMDKVSLDLTTLDHKARHQQLKIKDMVRTDDNEAIIKAAGELGIGCGPSTEPRGWYPREKSFRISLIGYPSDRKVSIIKEIRVLTGLGLKEAKDASEALPYEITKTESEDKAADWAHRLRNAGGLVEVQEYDI